MSWGSQLRLAGIVWMERHGESSQCQQPELLPASCWNRRAVIYITHLSSHLAAESKGVIHGSRGPGAGVLGGHEQKMGLPLLMGTREEFLHELLGQCVCVCVQKRVVRGQEAQAGVTG